MKKIIEWVWIVENGRITVNTDVSGNIFDILKKTISELRKEITEKAKTYVWYPSVWYHGPNIGKDITWFDCSGFITYILEQHGVAKKDIRHTNEYFDDYGIFVHRESIQPGDLIFFSRDGVAPKHIGIVISHDEYIHAPGKADTIVEISKIEDTEIANNLPGKLYTKNPIGFKRIVLERKSDSKTKKRWNKII